MNHTNVLPAACLGVLLSTSACLPTQYPYCEETVTVLDSLDSPTPAGVTAGELLALVEGQRTAEFAYAEAGGEAVHVSIEPGGAGSTELTLDLSRPANGALRWIDSVEVDPTGPGPTADIAVHCPNRLELDAELSFATADGVFAELFDVTVAAEIDGGGSGGELRVARIVRAFDPAALMGALTVVSIDPPNPDSVDYSLEIHYPLTESAAEGGEIGEPRGFVGGGAQHTHGTGKNAAVSYGSFTIGRFGGWKIY
jgi:hypothetical protein